MTSLSKEDLDLMSTMGVTALRVNVPWEAVEPTQGSYNETWLDQLEALVDTAYLNYNIQVCVCLCVSGRPHQSLAFVVSV
jgi:beta-glucosidase/6-phospho-beta-glucosidase/beta-galactosidase